jgi:hypothetical protein
MKAYIYTHIYVLTFIFELIIPGQTWLVDQVSRSIDNKLDFVKTKMQPKNHGDNVLPEEPLTQNGEANNKSFLSSEQHGSRRHLHQLAMESLCVVSAKGPPSLFITLTANSHWTEITDRLLPGQTAFDRPEVVDQVFHAKLQKTIHNIKNGSYFGHGVDSNGKHVSIGHKVVYIMYVIEYQHRGLPHAHIVLQFDKMPGKKYTCILMYV